MHGSYGENTYHGLTIIQNFGPDSPPQRQLTKITLISLSPLHPPGEMSFAVNVIGHYVLPWDWTNSPMKVNCAGRRRRGVRDMTLRATCQPDRSLQITVQLADINIDRLNRVCVIVIGVWFCGVGCCCCCCWWWWWWWWWW